MTGFIKFNNFDNQSEYFKWRCLIGLAHVDFRLMKDEQDFLESYIREYASENIQNRLLEELREDLVNPQDPRSFYELITDPEDRVELYFMAYKLFWSDGEMAQSEKKNLDYIKKNLLEDYEAREVFSNLIPGWNDAEPEDTLTRYVESL